MRGCRSYVRAGAALLALSLLVPLSAPAVAQVSAQEQGPACDDAPEGRFPDVSGVHQPGIDCIGWWGVTQGGADGTYNPSGVVRRDQMATFVARVIELSGGDLPDGPTADFVDIAGNVHADAIRQLASIEVVGGVGDGAYEPAGSVNRGQMGAFLARAWQARTGEELPIDPAVSFTDIDGNVHADNILRIASAGFTGGVGDGRYDPAAPVTRAQMGTFLARFLAALVEQGVTDYPPADPVPLPGQPDPDPAPEPDPEPDPDPAPDPDPDPAPEPDPDPQPDGVAPIGTGLSTVDGFTISVRATIPDATELVLEENANNEPPAEGNRYFIATIRVTVDEDEIGRFNAVNRLQAIAESGRVYDQLNIGDWCGGPVPDGFTSSRTAFRGGSIQGNICMEVADDDVDSLELFDMRSGPEQGPRWALSGADAEVELPEAPAPTGPRADPRPVGEEFTLGEEWTVRVLETIPDAAEQVAAASPSNEPAQEGRQYVLTTLEVTYSGEQQDLFPDSRLRATGVSTALVYDNTLDSCGFGIPDALPLRFFEPGETFAGAFCLEVFSQDVDGLLLFDAGPGLLLSEVPEVFHALE